RGGERERRERRAQRIVTRLEEWVGNLSKAQVDRVNQYSARAPLIEEMRDRDNKRLQGEVLAIIRAHEARKRLPERMAYWERGRDPAFAAARAANQQEFYQMLLDLDRLGTPEQRALLAAEVRRYAGEFRALAARRGSSRASRRRSGTSSPPSRSCGRATPARRATPSSSTSRCSPTPRSASPSRATSASFSAIPSSPRCSAIAPRSWS